MATSRDDSKSNYYHQTMELHLDFGTEVLRRIIENELDKMGFSLKDYLNRQSVSQRLSNLKQKKRLYQSQWNLLYPVKNQDPQLSNFDTTLLILLLIRTSLPISADEKKTIQQLLQERNFMAHLPKAELNDKTHFNVTSTLIIELSGTVSQAFSKEMKQNITDLQRREFVSCRSSLDIINIRNEELMVILIDRPDDHKVDEMDTTYLKYGLTKWTKQFVRTIELDTFMTHLKNDGVLSYTEKLEIEKAYNKEEQCSKLIMKMLDETKNNFLKFMKCLRSVDSNLADLIENKNKDGREIDLMLQNLEKDTIRSVLTTYVKEDKSGKVTSESLHLLVEMELGYNLQYTVVEQMVQETFNIDQTECSFHGITLNDSGIARLAEMSILTNACEAENKQNLAGMTCDTLAKYLREECEMMKAGIGVEIEAAIREECITPSTFIDFTRADMKEAFSDYISYDKIPFGVLKFLEKTQREIQRDTSSDCETNITLRELDSPSDGLVYKKGQVSPPDGNLMIPAHEFRTLPSDGEFTQPFIIRESVRFIAACLNTRKNGTIHFGIQGIGNGCGLIVGITNASYSVKGSLNLDLNQTIEACFDERAVPFVKRCVRPFQIINMEDGSAVLEMDVIPFSGYTKSEFFYAHVPPKGKQDRVLIVYNSKHPWDIVEVPHKKENATKQLYGSNIQKRKFQENANNKYKDNTSSLTNKLVSLLTAGSEYVTDQFTPIICCGKISGCQNECDIRQHFDVPEAFLSSAAIFDFDSSVSLRNQVEKDDTAFQVITADDTKPEESIENCSDRIWMYCNGNTELNKNEMNLQVWYKHRFNSVKQTISVCAERTPRQRAIIIFLAFCKQGSKDALLELAEDCIKSKFRDQCVVIAESEEVVVELKDKLKGILSDDDIAKCFHIGMSWREISDTLKTVFRTTTYQDYKLPCSNGHFAIMTEEEKRKLNFTDIEILGGEECKRIAMTDDDITRRNRKKTEQENFYKGGDVTWWNFYYGDQVGKRDLHVKFLKQAEDILKYNRDHLIEVLKIRHQVGAGGSTAGKYLLWQLSQFENLQVRDTYRCCVIKQITEDTANQIYKFLSFKDKTPKPVVFLTDNEIEEQIRLLLSRLNQLAYKHVNPGRLFSLHIEVNRVSVSYAKGKDVVLKHILSKPEQTWFETKYTQLTQSDTDVDTLISFNVMRRSFDKKYIKQLAHEIMKGIRDTELDVLKCLSLINTFDRDNVIPVSTFDCLVVHDKAMYGGYSLQALKDRGPIGLVVPVVGERQKENTRQLWNVEVTDELDLLLKRGFDVGNQRGVMIISQALAEAVLDYIKTKENLSLFEIVEFVLDIVKEHAKENNQMSKQFVKVVNSLFKTRSIFEVERNIRTPFSEMVSALQQSDGNESVMEANMKIVGLMEQCFRITSDALVGQQLARFLMSINDYKKAEETIDACLSLKPNSSYILSSYGQVYRCKMESIISQTFPPIYDDDAVPIIETAFKAIDKFVLGQKYAKSAREMEDVDTTCFLLEVKTVVFLLERGFPKFACYRDREHFLSFLNNPQFDIKSSSFRELTDKCSVEKLRKGSSAQTHVEESLRRLEEREYQIKRNVYKTDKIIDEKQVTKLRISFEDFYGTTQNRSRADKCHIKGLKSLMNAKADNADYLRRRVTEAEFNLEHLEEGNINDLEMVDMDDLLVLLGYELMQMSDSEPKLTPMETDRYKRLLWFSEVLLQQQCSSSRAYLEAFLYFAMLHWPSKSRLMKVDTICKPAKYIYVLKDWKTRFDDNFDRKNRAKNFFVLGKGDIGCDIVDLDDCIRRKWKELKEQEQNRRIRPVFNDDFWKEPFVIERLERLQGKSDPTGNSIEYQIKYKYWEYNVSIRTYYPCPQLKNRRVTFILGFTWGGLAAFDVEEIDKPYTGGDLRTLRQNSVVENLTVTTDSTPDVGAEKEKTLNLEPPKNATSVPIYGAEGGEPSNKTEHNKTLTTRDVAKKPKSPVELLSARTKNIKYEEVNRQGGGEFIIWVTIEDQTYEGRGRSKTQAKQDAARNALKELSEITFKPKDTDVKIEDETVTEIRPDNDDADTDTILDVSRLTIGQDKQQLLQREETPDSGSPSNVVTGAVNGAEGGESSPTECRSGSATKEDSKKPSSTQKNPVELLNDRMKHLKYEEVNRQGDGEFVIWVTIEDQIYEGRGQSKKQAKQEAARNALKGHFNVHLEPGSECVSSGERGTTTGNKKKKKKKR